MLFASTPSDVTPTTNNVGPLGQVEGTIVKVIECVGLVIENVSAVNFIVVYSPCYLFWLVDAGTQSICDITGKIYIIFHL